MRFIVIIIWCIVVNQLISCTTTRKPIATGSKSNLNLTKIPVKNQPPPVNIKTNQVDPHEVIVLAESLIGIPYQYGSANPEKGLDCSGFIWYVFKQFGITTPRISEQFTNAGVEVPLSKSKPGDLILFTGSDPKSQKVGHIGFISDRDKDDVWFIHSASGGNKGVMKSNLNRYFRERFVKVNRVFPD